MDKLTQLLLHAKQKAAPQEEIKTAPEVQGKDQCVEPPAPKKTSRKKPGRPMLGDRPMTSTERSRRSRARQKKE